MWVIVTMRVHTSLCLYLVVDRNMAIWTSRPNCVGFPFVRLDERRSQCTKQSWTHQTTCRLAFWVVLAAYRNMRTNRDGQNAKLRHELRSAVRLAVRFPKVYCLL